MNADVFQPQGEFTPPTDLVRHGPWLARLAERLEERRKGHVFRELNAVGSPAEPEITLGQGSRLIQFASNNYLGLATDPEVVDAAREAVGKWGTGSGASRLVAGSLEIHHELEGALARFKHAEAALLFPTGYMANLAALTTFVGPGDLILSDKLNHASLLDAAECCGAVHRTYPHGNMDRVETLLARGAMAGDAPADGHRARARGTGIRARGRKGASLRMIVTDTVFSMDGDTADLLALAQLAGRHSSEPSPALLITDEAHATGVLGPTGAGLAELQGVESQVALSVGTLSKALGSVGGFITGPRAVVETLINEARPFIYTTALPPSASAAGLAALRIVEREPARRGRLLQLSKYVRKQLESMGYHCGPREGVTTPIIPVILGSSANALAAAAFLRERGLFVPAIRPPTVAPNMARLRLSLMATHTDEQIERLLSGMKALATRNQAQAAQ